MDWPLFRIVAYIYLRYNYEIRMTSVNSHTIGYLLGNTRYASFRKVGKNIESIFCKTWTDRLEYCKESSGHNRYSP